VHEAGILDLMTAGFAVKEVLDARVQNLEVAGFAAKEVHDADIQNLKAAGFGVQEVQSKPKETEDAHATTQKKATHDIFNVLGVSEPFEFTDTDGDTNRLEMIDQEMV